MIKGSVNSKAGNVAINSYAGMNYNTVEALQTQFKEFFAGFCQQFKDGAAAVKRTFTKYESQINKELDALSKAQDPEAYMTSLKELNEKISDTKSTGFAAAVEALDKGNAIKDSFAGMIPVLTSFLHPANYSNYYVRSAFSEDKTSDEIGASELSAAGSFAINSMPNTSRVILAENSAVTADKGSVDIKSNAENRIVAITGMGGEYGTSSEAANRGAGISVNVSNFKDNSVVAVGKNSQIKAANINIETKEYAKHFNLIYGNGKADSTSVTGMVSYFNAPANNIISIDDSTKLDATNAATGFNNAVGLDANSERYITTLTGALTLGNGNGKSFGATINVLNNNVNNAILLADNGKGTRSSINGTTLENKADAKILTLTNKTLDILGDYGELLGNSSADGTGEINASLFRAYAKKTGTINSIAVAGTENSETHGFIDGFNNYVKKGSDYLQGGEMVLGMLPSLLSKYVGSKVNDKLNHSEQNNPDDAADEAEEQAGNENGGPNLNLGNAAPQLNIAGAGSVAVNLNSGETGAFVTNYKINTDTSNVRANDDTFHGSWAGAGAFNFFGDSQAAENTNVAVGGSVALTQSVSNVDSVVKNSVINSHYLDNEVNRADSDVSAGMGLAVSTGDEGTNVNIPISASINLLEGDTHSLLLNNNFTGVNRENSTGGSVRSDATIDSVQVAGGLALGVSKSEEKGYNIGGTAAVSQITNDLQSGIKGGSYENVQNANITAIKKSNPVDVAVAGGVTAGSNDGGFAFDDAVAVSDINNTANAFLKDTSKFNANGTVQIDAPEAKNSSSRNDYLSRRAITTDATEYLANDDKNKLDTINGGGNIVNVAFGGGGSTYGASSGGVGVSYSGLTNIMNVDIANNESITAKNFNVNTTNKSNIVNVADQASLSDEFAAGLTFAYNAMNNTTGTEIKGGTWNVGDFGLNSANNNYALAVGAGGKSVISAAGSTALNYINNSTQTLVENENIAATKNFGVVAQSNDKIANYAGAVDVNADGNSAIGVSVAVNEIKGNTDALIKNSNLEVGNSTDASDLISISNPKDNLIDNYVTRNTWTSGRLMSGRTTDKKSGLVVNSSATHSISSNLATIGIRADDDSPGVGVSGTVNINKIDGATNSKIESGKDGKIESGDVFVNAADYTNNGSFIGNAAVSGTVAVGVLWNENQVKCGTNSLVDGGTLNVNNLDVKADAAQGLSNLNIAVGASFTTDEDQIFAAASGDNIVRNQLDGKTTAKIENATVNHSGAVDVNSYHKDNAYATNIAAGVAFDTESAGAFGTAGVAIHVGPKEDDPLGASIAIALGINNNYITNTVHAGIKDSTLDVGAVDVNSKNSSTLKADGGVAAVSLNISKFFFASLGSATAITNGTFDNDVKAFVDNSMIKAAGDVNINARDDHKSDETVVSAALSTGLAVSVNRMSTSINSGLSN